MLSSIRNFSKSIYAKILLGIVVVPFVFWGMGSSLTSGSKNVVVKIDDQKYSVQDFVNFVQRTASNKKKIESEMIDQFLSTYIGNKIIEKEYEYFDIKLSDISLSKLIKNQKEFKKENEFSRTEYEKFLINNNINAVRFETNLASQEKRKQLLSFIGGGVTPAKFIVSNTFNKINQKRTIDIINLNDIFLKESSYTENDIDEYYKNNKKSYNKIFKTAKVLKINPKILINSNEYNDLFFKKIDEIDNLIAQGNSLNSIISEFNLEDGNVYTLNEFGENINLKLIENLSKKLVDHIYKLDNAETISLIEDKDKFFILEIIKTEKIQMKVKNRIVRKNIEQNLNLENKRKLISNIMSKINQGNFLKTNFDKLAKDKNVIVKKISIDSLNDNKILKTELINQIYSFPEKRVIIVNDISLTENYLIYIDKIENVLIDYATDEFKKYSNLSKIQITNTLFNTYDDYIKSKYEIDINYKALNTVKNYFN